MFPLYSKEKQNIYYAKAGTAFRSTCGLERTDITNSTYTPSRQLPVRPGRQEVEEDKLARAQLLIQPELDDLEEQYVLTDSLASENTISRPCYFSPSSVCLTYLRRESIICQQKKLADEELANRKKIRSTENRARLESIRKAANGLFGAQMAAQDKMLDLTAEPEDEEEPDTTDQTATLEDKIG
uniref:Uncharacterized protein n=1 Tax=Ditylenchus dipsaci TaxID=166011 RepID=A0A915E5Z3_9BILA